MQIKAKRNINSASGSLPPNVKARIVCVTTITDREIKKFIPRDLFISSLPCSLVLKEKSTVFLLL